MAVQRSLASAVQTIANQAASSTGQVSYMRRLHSLSRTSLFFFLAALLPILSLFSVPLSAERTSGDAPLQTATTSQGPGTIIVRVASVAVDEGQTTVDTSLELAGVTAELNVGAISVDVLYDTALLKATACTVNDSLDLLLCNIATPGVIQLAGVAANGIRSDLTLAGLSFDILQPENLFTQLTVQLDTITDIEGATLNATAHHGQIGEPCTPGSEGCPVRAVIHLPLVHR